MDLLQEYTFISLDNFTEIHKNKSDNTLLEAWLVFFTEESPEGIEALLEARPEFRPLYEDAYVICRNIERVMEMFSKELQILDRNTVNLMIDEMREELNALRAEKDTLKKETDTLKKETDTLKKETGTLQEERDTLQEEKDTLQEENDRLRAELAALKN